MTTYYWDTQPIIVTRSGTNWTVDVTLCQLDQDLSIKDFEVLFNDIPTSSANFTKTTATLLTYTGPSIGSSAVEVRRFTPTAPVAIVAYQQRFSSADYNRELERSARQIAEFRALGVGVGSNQVNVNDAAYSSAWDGDVSNAPSRNAVYDEIQEIYAELLATETTLQNAIDLKAPLASPAFSGTPTAPTAPTDTSNTQLATTAYVRANRSASEAATQLLLDAKAPINNAALTGTPTAPTAAVGTNTTQLATTAFVQAAKPTTQVSFATSYTTSPASGLSASVALTLGTQGGAITNTRGSGMSSTGYVIPVSGIYTLSAGAILFGSSQAMGLGMRLNSDPAGQYIARTQVNDSDDINAFVASVSTTRFFTAGDDIRLEAVFQGGSNSLQDLRFDAVLVSL